MNTDITKCQGKDCPIKDSCMRYTKPPDEHRQSYFSFSPGEVNDDGVYKCEMYWGDAQEQIIKQLNDIFNGKS